MAKKTPKQPSKPKKTTQSQVQKLTSFASSLKHRTFFRLFVLWLASYLVLMSFFLSTVLKNNTYLEVFPRELVLPTFMHGLTAAIITLVIYWLPWLKSFAAKLFSAVMLALFTVGYDSSLQAIASLIRAFTPGLTDTDTLSLVSLVYLALLVVLAVIFGVGLERLIRKAKRLQPQDVQLGLLVLVAYLFLVPFFSVVKILPTMIQETHTQAPEISAQLGIASAEEKPDIFYIVLDRYTNADVLSKQFDYDNSPFTDFLRDKDFYVNDSAHSSYPYTTMSISSTLNAQYTNELVAPYKDNALQSRTLYHNLIWQSSVAKAFKNNGYEYYAIGSSYGATYKAPLADHEYNDQHILTVFGHKKRLRGIESIEFMKSPYYRFAQLPNIKWWPAKVVDSDDESGVDTIQQLKTLDILTTKEKPGGRFIFAHILVPHDPFIFNGDGSLSAYPSSDNTGKPIKDKYVEQVEFINSQMKELVSNIQKQSDGKAVVIFNADEGAYPDVMNATLKAPTGSNEVSNIDDMRTLSDDWLNMKFGILQAVHIPKATEDDLANLSSVNVFRIILNRYVGANLDYLPECHFGLTNGAKNMYNYADITKRFVLNPDKQCEQLQSLPKNSK